MFTDQDCFRISLGLDPHQELLAFHDLDRQFEINQPRLREGQRQLVLRVDIMGAVAGMGPHVELKERSAPRVALGAEIDCLEQVISLASGPPLMSNQSSISAFGRAYRNPPVQCSERNRDLLNLFVGLGAGCPR
jgi:hypothetical protein